VKIGAKVFWLQLGIRSLDAKEVVESNNIKYIENRCTKMEYQKIFLNINPAFPVLQD
jgi:predicted CoA-binding protein